MVKKGSKLVFLLAAIFGKEGALFNLGGVFSFTGSFGGDWGFGGVFTLGATGLGGVFSFTGSFPGDLALGGEAFSFSLGGDWIFS